MQPAPITELSPIVTPGSIVAFDPMDTPLPILGGKHSQSFSPTFGYFELYPSSDFLSPAKAKYDFEKVTALLSLYFLYSFLQSCLIC